MTEVHVYCPSKGNAQAGIAIDRYLKNPSWSNRRRLKRVAKAQRWQRASLRAVLRLGRRVRAGEKLTLRLR